MNNVWLSLKHDLTLTKMSRFQRWNCWNMAPFHHCVMTSKAASVAPPFHTATSNACHFAPYSAFLSVKEWSPLWSWPWLVYWHINHGDLTNTRPRTCQHWTDVKNRRVCRTKHPSFAPLVCLALVLHQDNLLLRYHKSVTNIDLAN